MGLMVCSLRMPYTTLSSGCGDAWTIRRSRSWPGFPIYILVIEACVAFVSCPVFVVSVGYPASTRSVWLCCCTNPMTVSRPVFRCSDAAPKTSLVECKAPCTLRVSTTTGIQSLDPQCWCTVWHPAR